MIDPGRTGPNISQVIRPILSAAAMTTLGALPVYLLSAQSVLVADDLNFGAVQLGLAVSAFFAAGALVSVILGPLTDRLGRRRSTVIAGCLAGASTAGIALAAVSYPALVALLALAGVGNAAMQITANAAIARSVPHGRRGVAYAFKQCAVPVSILFGGLAVPTAGVLLGWRWTFGATAVCASLVVVGGLRLSREQHPGTRTTVTGQRPPTGALLVTAVAMTSASAACTSLGAFLPAWAFEVGLTPGTAGLLLAAVSAMSIALRLGAGLAADRRRGRHLRAVTIHLVIGAAGLLLLSVDGVASLVSGALLAFAIGWSWPGLLLYAVVRVGRDRPATSSSAVQAGAFAGGAIGPVLFGVLVGATSYPTAWRAAAVAMLMAAGLLIVAARMFRGDLERRPPLQPLDAVLPLDT